MTSPSSARDQVLVAINRHVEYAIKRGQTATDTNAAIEESLINHLASLVERNVSIPEETAMIILGLLVVFELRRRESEVDLGATRQ